ncbi:ABC transporter substrate-binding protein [Beduinella massiliensis]|uniref:ABC transporter substrate-binding protein n=1 Tax=Beduinella massiliensis TaxID=1852363 RepID=UPI0031F93227
MIKKMMGLLLSLLLVLALALSAQAQDAVNVVALKGPTGIGMVKMMDENDGTYAFTLAGAPDEVVAAIASGSADIAAAPTNLAASLFSKTNGNVQLLALNTLGVLHILEKGDSVRSVGDLSGRTLYATGQGAVPEYVLNYILAQNGLEGKVNVEYKAEHSELATLAAAGEVDLVMLPEPNVTSVLMNNADFREALDVTELFSEAAEKDGKAGTALSMGCVIVRRDFAEKNPEKVAAFLEAYGASVAFVNGDVDAASALVEAQGILPKAAVAKRAIPNCHIVFVEGEEMKTQIEPFFEMLFEANPASVGGKLPADDFYYAR